MSKNSLFLTNTSFDKLEKIKEFNLNLNDIIILNDKNEKILTILNKNLENNELIFSNTEAIDEYLEKIEIIIEKLILEFSKIKIEYENLTKTETEEYNIMIESEKQKIEKYIQEGIKSMEESRRRRDEITRKHYHN